MPQSLRDATLCTGAIPIAEGSRGVDRLLLELSHRLLCYRTSKDGPLLKKNIAHARDMARRLLADGVEGITLTYYADEGSFRAMKLPEEGDDFEHRQRSNAETAKVMLAHGLDLKVQVLNAEEYFAWLGVRPHTYQTLHEYPGGRHVSGDQAKALLGID